MAGKHELIEPDEGLPLASRSRPGGSGPERPRARKRWEQRRQQVVDIAAHVFAQRGYHATTIDDLVAATGLQRGGLYHYMNSKQELLIRIHERFIDPLLEESERIVAEDLPADIALRRIAHTLMHDIAQYRDQVTVFLHEWRIIENEPEWQHVREARRRFEGFVEQILRRGCDQGLFELTDVRVSVFAFLGMINYTYQWYRPGGRMSTTELADHFAAIFLTGVMAPGVKPSAPDAEPAQTASAT